MHALDGKRRDASGRIFDGKENETMVARKARLVSRGRVKSRDTVVVVVVVAAAA